MSSPTKFILAPSGGPGISALGGTLIAEFIHPQFYFTFATVPSEILIMLAWPLSTLTLRAWADVWLWQARP